MVKDKDKDMSPSASRRVAAALKACIHHGTRNPGLCDALCVPCSDAPFPPFPPFLPPAPCSWPVMLVLLTVLRNSLTIPPFRPDRLMHGAAHVRAAYSLLLLVVAKLRRKPCD